MSPVLSQSDVVVSTEPSEEATNDTIRIEFLIENLTNRLAQGDAAQPSCLGCVLCGQ